MSSDDRAGPVSRGGLWTAPLLAAAGAIAALLLVPRRARARTRVARMRPPAPPAIYDLRRYPPRSSEAVVLFTSAARFAGLPDAWASAPELHAILEKESGGYVGRPNYQFGAFARVDQQDRWPEIWTAIQAGTWRALLAEPYRTGPRAAQSSASGLGQLTSTNIPSYYPSGLAGIGIPLEEAIGMLRYIAARYGSPERAWARYGLGQEGY